MLEVFSSRMSSIEFMVQCKRSNYLPQRAEILNHEPNLFHQRAKNTVNDLPQMAKNNVDLFPCASLSDITKSTAHCLSLRECNSGLLKTMLDVFF